jgi:hypothetical protein
MRSLAAGQPAVDLLSSFKLAEEKGAQHAQHHQKPERNELSQDFVARVLRMSILNHGNELIN